MDPYTLFTIAKGIFSATGLDAKVEEWIGGKVLGNGVVKKIADIAQAVVGHTDIQAMSPDQLASVKTAILDAEADIRKIAQEDLKSARAMYSETEHTMADKIAASVIKWNLWMVVMLVGVNVGVLLYVTNPTIAVAVGNIIGASISYLWQERQSVIGFFFGSSHGSKTKTKLLGK